MFSQELYINKILRHFKMKNLKPMDTLIARSKISNDMCPQNYKDKKEMKKIPYLNAIGSLMYVMLCTWPNFSQAIGSFTCYSSNPSPKH